MLSKEEIEKILDANVDIITYKADKDYRCLTSTEKTLLENNKKAKEYIEQLENKLKKLGIGQQTLTQSRKKWKIRYYNIRKRHKKLIEKLENKTNLIVASLSSEIVEKYKNFKMTDIDDNTYELLALNDLNTITEILSILKGEKE